MKKASRIISMLLALTLFLGASNFTLMTNAANTEGMTFNATRIYYSDKVMGEAPKTYEAVVKFPAGTDSTTRGGVILGNNGAGKDVVNFEIQTMGKPRLYVVSAGKTYDTTFSACPSVYTGEWVHIAIVHEENALKCYINGELKETVTKKVPYVTSNAYFVLGGDQSYKNPQYFKGSIKSVACYKDVRTAAEVTADAKAYGTDDLYLRYDMSSVSADITSVKDLSNNGMNASFTRWIDPSEYQGVKDYDFSFAVVGDTQIINNTKTNTHQLKPLYTWIKNNVESKKIQFVMGLGDITENQNDTEYAHAKENIKLLDGIVPYSLIRGNHDNRDDKFTSYFKYDAYTKNIKAQYRQSSLNNVCFEIKVGEIDYLIFGLDYGPSDPVLQWAGQIIEANPKHNVIITTHAYLYRDGTTIDANAPADMAAPTKTSPRGDNDGDHMWNKFIKKYENIVLVLSGHDPCNEIVVTQTKGDHGNVVTQMLIDPQGMDANIGPTGMVAMLYFSDGGKKVQVEYYSTLMNKYWPAPETLTVHSMASSAQAAKQPQFPMAIVWAIVGVAVVGGAAAGVFVVLKKKKNK